MILVTGSFTARADCVDEALRLSLAHVHRSRLEDGCISHAVHRDAENPARLVFVEHWRDRESLARHFARAESNAFVKAAAELAVVAPQIDIFDAAPTSVVSNTKQL